MKTKNILFVALLVLLTVLASCKKDHIIPTGEVFNADDLDANDFEIVGTWGVEKIDYYDIDNAGNPIASTLQSHEYDPNDIDNGIQMVFREDNTGELYDKTSVDSTKVNPFAYTYVNDTLFLEIDYGTDTSTYSCIIVEKTNDSFIYENEYFLNHVEKAYLKRLSHEPIVLSDVFTVSVSANPSNGGTVTGGGTYQQGQSCTVTATTEAGYAFVNWTENGSQVSTEASYTFTVTGNRTLVANFQQQTTDQTFTVNGVSFTMKRVEGGTFWMGAQSTDQGEQNYDSEAYDYESPVHSVTLSTFYMGETEVTQELWQAVMGSNPSHFSGTNLPVEQVSWNMIVNEFLPALNAATGQNFRLPTEAEWEYAARGGNQGHDYKYAGSNTIGNVAWYYGNSNNQTHAVAMKQPNELGLYDMSGNVWEWCGDWYGNYSSGSQTNPQGPSSGSGRVLRGGGWGDDARNCRVSRRGNSIPVNTAVSYGFRLALPQ